jgi:hypothetical protein
LEEPLELAIWEEDETVPVGPADLLLTLPVGLGPTPDDDVDDDVDEEDDDNDDDDNDDDDNDDDDNDDDDNDDDDNDDDDNDDDDNDDDPITVLEADDDETTEEVLETAEELVDGDPQFLSEKVKGLFAFSLTLDALGKVSKTQLKDMGTFEDLHWLSIQETLGESECKAYADWVGATPGRASLKVGGRGVIEEVVGGRFVEALDSTA